MQIKNRFIPIHPVKDASSSTVTQLLASAKMDLCIEDKDPLGEVRYSDNQPKCYGHPFVIHLSQADYRLLTPLVRERLKHNQVEVTECFPKFLRTEEPLVRLRFHDGDKALAFWFVEVSRDQGLKVYRNWTDNQKLER